MGARVYLPTIGRFTSPDPIDGGNANAYVYVVDPINANDYTGMFGLGDIWHGIQAAGGAVKTGAGHVANGVGSVLGAVFSTSSTAPHKSPPAQPKIAPNFLMRPAPRKGNTGHPAQVERPFDYYNAANTAFDYYGVGTKIGGGIGCGVGAALSPEALGAGCLLLGPIGYAVGGIAFAVYGFYAGGLGSNHADLDYGPDPVPGKPWE